MFFNSKKKTKLERLYDKYKYLLFAKAMSVLNDSMLAEDAVSQTFEKLSAAVDRIDEENECKTISYLSIICYHEAVDILEKHKKEFPADFIETAFDEESATEENPENIVISKDACNRIAASIEELKPIYKEVFNLYIFHGLTAKEIALVLGITPEAAEKRIQRAKKLLREKLKEEELL